MAQQRGELRMENSHLRCGHVVLRDAMTEQVVNSGSLKSMKQYARQNGWFLMDFRGEGFEPGEERIR